MENDNRGPVSDNVKESTAPGGGEDSNKNGLDNMVKKAVIIIKEEGTNAFKQGTNAFKQGITKVGKIIQGVSADSNKKKDNTGKMLSENLPVQGHQKPTPLDEIIRNNDQIRPLLNKTEDICLDENWIDQRATPQKLLLVWQDTLRAESELLYNNLVKIKLNIESSKKWHGGDKDTIALETLKAWMSWLHNEDMHLKRKGNYGDRVLITREIRGDYQNWKDLCEDGTDVDFEAYIEYGPWYYTKDNQEHLLSLGSLAGRTEKDKE